MTPLRFGPPGRQLFGLLEMPPGSPSTGIVLCPPFGQEAIRTHRILRVLGERLAQAGHAVLRFDWFASGDSDGDDGEAGFAEWIADVGLADRELRELAGVVRTRWLGLRLGGSLALMAAAGTGPAPERIGAWDPVVDGPGYRDELDAAHRRAMLTGAVGFVPSMRFLRYPESIPATSGEALGFPVTASLGESLRSISPGSFRNPASIPVDLFLGPSRDATAAQRSLASSGAAAALVRLDADVPWLVDETDEFPSPPAKDLRAIVDHWSAP